MDKLKPCPFCGSDNMGVYEHSYPMEHYYFVFCNECKAESGNFETKEKAILAWNRRAEDAK